jgi:hypothetical protein
MRTEVLGEADFKTWDDIVAKSVNGSLYHSWSWLKIAEKHSDSQLIPLVFFDADNNEPFGAIPLFFMKKMGIKMVFSPPPQSAIRLGPLIVDKGYKQHKLEMAYLAFQSGIDKYIKNLGSNYTLIVTNPGLLDVRPFSWAGYLVAPRYTYEIDLKSGQEAIWKNLSRSLRTNINNAPKRGINVAESQDVQHLEDLFYSLKSRYTQQHIKLPLKLEYLKDLYREFGGSAIRIFLATHDGKAVGSTTCLISKNTVIQWVGGTRTDSNNLEANELLMWHTINKAVSEGFNRFEIEGANTSHLCDAKSRYNPSPIIYFEIKKSDLSGHLAERMYLLMKKTQFH